MNISEKKSLEYARKHKVAKRIFHTTYDEINNLIEAIDSDYIQVEDWMLPFNKLAVVIDLSVIVLNQIGEGIVLFKWVWNADLKVSGMMRLGKDNVTNGTGNSHEIIIYHDKSIHKGKKLTIETSKSICETFDKELFIVLKTVIVLFEKFAHDTKLFVVKQTKYKQNKRGKKRMELATYRILHIKDIRTKYIYNNKSSNSTDSNIRPVERSGFWRTYSHKRYVNMQGKKRWINSTWVGPVKRTDKDKCVIFEVLPNLHQED